MSNLLKLSLLTSGFFAMIVFGACGGGGGGGGGNYSGGGKGNPCAKVDKGGSQGSSSSTDTAAGIANSVVENVPCNSTATNVNYSYMVTNGLTYYKTGTETEWQLYTGTYSTTATNTSN